MKIKILQKSKVATPNNVNDATGVNTSLTVKDKVSFVTVFCPEIGETPAYVEPEPPPVETEPTAFIFYPITATGANNYNLTSQFNYNGVRLNLFTGDYYLTSNYRGYGDGDILAYSSFRPVITTNTGITLDVEYTVYTENNEIWMDGITFTSIEKATNRTDLYGNGVRWTIDGLHPELGPTFDAGGGISYTYYYSNVLPDSVIDNRTFSNVDLTQVYQKYSTDYPGTYQNSDTLGVYFNRLNNFFPNSSTRIFRIGFGAPPVDIGGTYHVIEPLTKIVNNYLIKIKDKFFIWTNPSNNIRAQSDVPSCIVGTKWDPNSPGYDSSSLIAPEKFQWFWQSNCVLDGPCFGPVPDGSTLDIKFTGSCYWEGNQLKLNVNAVGTDKDVFHGYGPVGGSPEDPPYGYPFEQWEWLYYDWAVFTINSNTKEMTRLAVAFNQQSIDAWENLQNVILGLPDSAYSQYIQPGMRLALLCRASQLKRSQYIYVNGAAADVADFFCALNGGVSPVSGCWEGTLSPSCSIENDVPVWNFSEIAARKTYWDWSYITVPEIANATPQTPVYFKSMNAP
jgi:hypothetical protein